MKKFFAYLICLISCMGVCWFGLLAMATPYAEPGRWQYIIGLGVSLFVGIIFAGIGNSLKWKKDK